MHPYSNDAARTRTVMLTLAITAILLAWGLGRVLRCLDVTPPWWLDTPAVAGFYGIVWRIYDRSLWCLQVGNQTLSGIPNYGGAWTGWVHSSHDSVTMYAARLTIRQTSSRILIELHTDRSRSVSHMAMVCAGPGSAHGLQYIYANWPRHVPTPAPDVETVRLLIDGQHQVPPGSSALHPHEGVSRLVLSRDGTMEGDYQTDRHRGTYGTLCFETRVTQ